MNTVKPMTLTPLALNLRATRLTMALGAVLLVSGCASNFNRPYRAPALTIPVQYSQASAAAGADATAAPSAPVGLWWMRFNDPELDRLVAEVLQGNNNLAAAAIRVRRAQLLAGLADNNLQPIFSGGVGTSSSLPLQAGAVSVPKSSVSLSAAYEIDLWNKLGSLRDVARWEALATEQDRQSAALALVGTTAALYWQVGFLNQSLAVTAQSIAYVQTTFDLVQMQYRAGAVSGLEVAEAQQTLAKQQANLSALRQQAFEAQTALALLLDGSPGTRLANPATLPALTLPPLDAGVPAALLGRRPDLRAAEMRLRGTFTGIDAARASYYPAFSLTGSLGSSSTQLSNVVQNPVGTLGLGMTLPFLQRTAMQLTISVSETRYEEAVVNFRQALYTAFGDVENALSSRQQLVQQGLRLEETLQAARTVERLYEIRYRAGAATLGLWLDAQEKRRTADIAVAANRLARLKNQVVVYQALGGDAVVLSP
ncbi:MAG: NodT family efflux transporter outer membrane factor (OMF) lipoprotein [Litorivivens sp.]|jgi:NodT family efflux transporter outer membrane factor (OMF) lipoprotein